MPVFEYFLLKYEKNAYFFYRKFVKGELGVIDGICDQFWIARIKMIQEMTYNSQRRKYWAQDQRKRNPGK